MLNHHADRAHAKAVHQNGDRNAGEKQQQSFPERRLEKIGNQKANGHQREEVAQSVAGFGHLQLVDAKVDDIAFKKNGNAKEPHEPDPDLRGQELQCG